MNTVVYFDVPVLVLYPFLFRVTLYGQQSVESTFFRQILFMARFIVARASKLSTSQIDSDTCLRN